MSSTSAWRLPSIDFELVRELAEPFANLVEVTLGRALVGVLTPEHVRVAERAQLLERLADVLHEPELLALRGELRKLPVDGTQIVREAVELLPDAVDLLAQRLLGYWLCYCDCGVHVFTVWSCRRALVVARNGFEREVGRLLQDRERKLAVARRRRRGHDLAQQQER